MQNPIILPSFETVDELKDFLDSFLTKLATQMFEHSPEEKAILEVAKQINYLNTFEVEEILSGISY